MTAVVFKDVILAGTRLPDIEDLSVAIAPDIVVAGNVAVGRPTAWKVVFSKFVELEAVVIDLKTAGCS